MLKKMLIVSIVGTIGFINTMVNEIPARINSPEAKIEKQEYEEYVKEVIARDEEERRIAKEEKIKAEEIAYLEEIEAQLEGMGAIEIQEYLDEHSIQYELERGLHYSDWKDGEYVANYQRFIHIVKGNHELNIMYYDKSAEEVYMGVQEVDS